MAQTVVMRYIHPMADTLKVATPPKKGDEITKLETDETIQEMMETALSLRPELKGKKSDLTGCSSAWKSGCFGSIRSHVQIVLPRQSP